VSEGKRDAIFGHMSDLYRDYRHKLKRKYFDSKSTYQLRLRNKPKHFGADEWKYLVNLWSDADFQVIKLKLIYDFKIIICYSSFLIYYRN